MNLPRRSEAAPRYLRLTNTLTYVLRSWHIGLGPIDHVALPHVVELFLPPALGGQHRAETAGRFAWSEVHTSQPLDKPSWGVINRPLE